MSPTVSAAAALPSRPGLMLVLLVSLSSCAFGASDDLAFEPAPPPEPVCHSACQQCGQQCDPCDLKLCTVMVSACVAETRVKVDVVKEQEEREEQYTAFKLVPKTRKYEKEECYLKREVKTKKVTDEDCHLVKMPVERTKNVKAYHPELREVCSADGACPPRTCEVMVETTVPEATVCEETQVVVSKTEREISYCVRTPKTRKVPCAEEKYYELVPVTKTRKVTVCVPKLVRTPYEVIVCKRIPKEIMCCPACADTPCK